MKKRYLTNATIFILSLFMLVVLFNVNIRAREVTTKTDDGKYNYTTRKEYITQISESTKYIENVGYTTRSGEDIDQVNRIFVADFKKGEDIKIATWAVPNEDGSGFIRTDLASIAKNYEETHPGYVVLAGINADQYYPKYGTGLGSNGTDYVYPQPYYPMVSGGMNWYSINPYGGTYNVVGFKNNGDNKQLVYGNRSIKGLYIHVYDENNNELASFKADDLNLTKSLTKGQTTVLSGYMSDNETYKNITKQSNNNLYLIENSEYSWVSNSVTYTWKSGKNVNAFFGQGVISKVTNEEITILKDQFAIETTNEELKKLLNIGTFVKCQYEFDDGFNGIEEAMGYHTIQRSNGKDGNVDNSYNTRSYPRSIVGCDDEGKVYLITCDGKNSAPLKGMYAQESNALMKQYNITDAFQMDGGGSVTSVYRNRDGEIVFANPPVESEYRYIFSGLFIVMKTADAKINIEEVTESSALFNVDLSNITKAYNNAYLKIGYGDTDKYSIYYEIKDNKVLVEGLKGDNEYTYSLCLNYQGKDNISDTFLMSKFKTKKDYPIINNLKIELNNDKYKISFNYDDIDNILSKIYIIINGIEYLCDSNDGLSLLNEDKSLSGLLDLNVKIECNNEDGTTRYTIIKKLDIEANANVYLNYMSLEINDFLNKIK